MDSSTKTGSFPIEGVSDSFYYSTGMHLFNVNSVDQDQTPHSVASGLSLHCLPVSFIGR